MNMAHSDFLSLWVGGRWFHFWNVRCLMLSFYIQSCVTDVFSFCVTCNEREAIRWDSSSSLRARLRRPGTTRNVRQFINFFSRIGGPLDYKEASKWDTFDISNINIQSLTFMNLPFAVIWVTYCNHPSFPIRTEVLEGEQLFATQRNTRQFNTCS